MPTNIYSLARYIFHIQLSFCPTRTLRVRSDTLMSRWKMRVFPINKFPFSCEFTLWQKTVFSKILAACDTRVFNHHVPMSCAFKPNSTPLVPRSPRSEKEFKILIEDARRQGLTRQKRKLNITPFKRFIIHFPEMRSCGDIWLWYFQVILDFAKLSRFF